MKQKEKWHNLGTRLDYTRFKLIFGTLLSVVLILTIGYIVYNSFQRILYSLDELSTSRQETLIINDLLIGISEVQNRAGTYSITMKSSDLQSYLKKRKEVTLLIDSLSTSIGKRDYYEKVDSLAFFFNQYIGSLNEWLIIKSTNPKDVINQLYATIEEGDSSLIEAVNNIPRSEITTVTTTVEKPVLDSKKEVKEGKEEKDKSFLKRFFRGNKTDKKESIGNIEKPKESIRREVTTETRIEPDTNYYQKVDTLLVKMKTSLSKAKIVKSNYNRRLKKRAIELLGNNLVLINKVNQLLKNIQQEEQAIAQQKVLDSKRNAHESYQKLVLLSLLGVLFALLFVYLIFMDISKSLYYKKMLQSTTLQAQKLAKVKEDFLANMSHEIRTPLNSIIGYVDQLSLKGLKGENIPPLKILESSSQHLLNLVNDILDYSKIESGAFHLEQIGFSLNDVVKETIHVLQPAAERKGLKFIYTPGQGIDDVLLGDPVRLKQILINLIGNGIKFTPKGYVSLELFAVKRTDDDYIVTCRVKDSGIGIEKEKMKQIFEEFSQADTSISRKYGGTGLGLSISKKLVSIQGGIIELESDVGQGSVFFIQIPYKKGIHDEYKIKQRTDYGDRLELKGKRVLVIDDDEMSGVLLKPVLNQWQIVSVFCDDSSNAWNLLQKNTYDLVILDLQMPVMDGWELIRRIRTQSEGLNKEVRLLLCTANVLVNEEEKLSSMVDGFLYKPFKYVQLWDQMINIFKQTTPVLSFICNEMEEKKIESSLYSLSNFRSFANEDPNQLLRFLQTFISCSKSDLKLITRFLQDNNLKQIGELAHKLKNMCGQLEAKEILLTLQELETLVDNQELSKIAVSRLVGVLDEQLNVLFEALEKEMNVLIG